MRIRTTDGTVVKPPKQIFHSRMPQLPYTMVVITVVWMRKMNTLEACQIVLKCISIIQLLAFFLSVLVPFLGALYLIIYAVLISEIEKP